MIKNLTLEEVKNIALDNLATKEEVNTVIKMMAEQPNAVRVNLRIYANGNEDLVVYVYDKNLYRYRVYDRVHLY